MTFFGMKLYTENIVVLNARIKTYAVLCTKDRISIVINFHIIRVHKIKPEIVGEPISQRTSCISFNLVPPNVWDLQLRRWKFVGIRRHPTQPLQSAFLTSSCQELHTQTNA